MTLKEFRQKHGLTQLDVCRLVGCTLQTASLWERLGPPKRETKGWLKIVSLIKENPTTESLRRRVGNVARKVEGSAAKPAKGKPDKGKRPTKVKPKKKTAKRAARNAARRARRAISKRTPKTEAPAGEPAAA